MAEAISLRTLNVGDTGTIASIADAGELNRRIRDMGLTPGTTVKVVGRAPLQDPIALRLSGVTIMLRNKEADYISVMR